MKQNQFTIIVKTQFDFTHRYDNAPPRVAFLRHPHRHRFYVEAEIEVFHDDRELEFLIVKEDITDYISFMTGKTGKKIWPVEQSCEQMCSDIKDFILREYGDRDVTVTVFEDNENGGRLRYVRENERKGLPIRR